ncbi:MAG: adenylyltransferase/cytidyltransferase family protein [Fidelibacterota bacterium]|nr:MAG: adenylyltransferase/cytidyltransferase family protein [Candidatus Neomarinimicrobiota bacterium]
MTSKELSWEACADLVRTQREKGETVVFTNGCFDVLHAGHIHLIEGAHRLGDRLVIGVNSDASVRRLKGPKRPFMPLQDRLSILGALSMVDALVVFPREADVSSAKSLAEVDTPYLLLQKLKPNVLVKGGDYRPDEVIGREFADEVHIVPLLEGHSSSDLIRRLEFAYEDLDSMEE